MSAHSDRRMKYGAILSCQSTLTKKKVPDLQIRTEPVSDENPPSFLLTTFSIYLFVHIWN